MIQDVFAEVPHIPVPTDGSSGFMVSVLSIAGTIILALIGKAIKDRMSGQRLEDASNNITVESLTSARERIRELEGQLREALQQTIHDSRTIITAERAASDAAAKAEQAAALAEDARRDADNTMALVTRQRVYIARLREAMLSAGLTPPEPDPEL